MHQKFSSSKKITYAIDRLPLNPGDYSVNIVVFDEDVINEYDHIEQAISFQVVADDHQQHGKVNLFGKWRQ